MDVIEMKRTNFIIDDDYFIKIRIDWDLKYIGQLGQICSLILTLKLNSHHIQPVLHGALSQQFLVNHILKLGIKIFRRRKIKRSWISIRNWKIHSVSPFTPRSKVHFYLIVSQHFQYYKSICCPVSALTVCNYFRTLWYF